MRTLTVVCQHVVRANQHGRDPAQLRDARYVSTVRRHRLHIAALPHPGRVRPRHLCFLRRRDVRQGRRDGSVRQASLSRRHVEPTRPLHRRCWVRFHIFILIAVFTALLHPQMEKGEKIEAAANN